MANDNEGIQSSADNRPGRFISRFGQQRGRNPFPYNCVDCQAPLDWYEIEDEKNPTAEPSYFPTNAGQTAHHKYTCINYPIHPKLVQKNPHVRGAGDVLTELELRMVLDAFEKQGRMVASLKARLNNAGVEASAVQQLADQASNLLRSRGVLPPAPPPPPKPDAHKIALSGPETQQLNGPTIEQRQEVAYVPPPKNTKGFNSKKLVQLRQSLGFSVVDMADAHDCSAALIRGWENGKILPALEDRRKLISSMNWTLPTYINGTLIAKHRLMLPGKPSQGMFAKMVNTAESEIIRAENGNDIRIGELAKIAAGLKCEVDDLLTEEQQ